MDATKTSIISSAMRELYKTIQSDDGVANAACMQAADRLDELSMNASLALETLRQIQEVERSLEVLDTIVDVIEILESNE